VTTVAQNPRLTDIGNQLIAQAPRWLFVLLIVAVGVRGALLVANLAGSSADINPKRAAGPAPAAARKVVDLPTILRANLFGQSAAPIGTDAPVTTMNLKLLLVFAASNEKHGFAALGPSNGEVKVYRVGDEVPGGARLHAVYVDRVLLDRGGVIEALLVPPREGSVGTAPPPAGPVNAAAAVERVQQVIRDNPNLINQVMQRQAIVENGRLAGVRVNPGQNAQAFSKLGLRPGDVVTAINGAPLDDQARANEIFNTMGSTSQAHLTVKRAGREMELNLNLAEIAQEAERMNDFPQPPEPGQDSTR
jgi:general secretion pathway protein C